MPKKKNISALGVKPGVPQAEVLNPHLVEYIKKQRLLKASNYVEGIRNGDVALLSRAITLVESHLPEHQDLAEEIINACLPDSGHSVRIGITGIPGVGKSTFIEAFGCYLIQQENKKLAVLAVDPSSQRTKGSILGDKTRMELLAREKNAFIRPSPSAGSLGGVARKTREITILCEAAGFDAVLIETVGVGQSETAVKSMVDFFLLLLLPGAGDELQGIKRGIMEMADAIVINKADGENLKKAQVAAGDVKRALRLYPQSDWVVPVLLCSSIEKTGIDDIWHETDKFIRHAVLKGNFTENRAQQAVYWLRETISEGLLTQFNHNAEVAKRYAEFESEIRNNLRSPFSAAKELIGLFLASQR